MWRGLGTPQKLKMCRGFRAEILGIKPAANKRVFESETVTTYLLQTKHAYLFCQFQDYKLEGRNIFS